MSCPAPELHIIIWPTPKRFHFGVCLKPTGLYLEKKKKCPATMSHTTPPLPQTPIEVFSLEKKIFRNILIVAFKYVSVS